MKSYQLANLLILSARKSASCAGIAEPRTVFCKSGTGSRCNRARTNEIADFDDMTIAFLRRTHYINPNVKKMAKTPYEMERLAALFSSPVKLQCTGVELFCLSTFACWATCCPAYWFTVLEFRFSSPVRRLDQPQGSGGLGEHCSSPAVGRGVCAPPGRVAQPRSFAVDRGYRAAAANRGRFLLVTFLGKTRKVTCRRATPGGVDFVFHPSTGSGRTVLFKRCQCPSSATRSASQTPTSSLSVTPPSE